MPKNRKKRKERSLQKEDLHNHVFELSIKYQQLLREKLNVSFNLGELIGIEAISFLVNYLFKPEKGKSHTPIFFFITLFFLCHYQKKEARKTKVAISLFKVLYPKNQSPQGFLTDIKQEIRYTLSQQSALQYNPKQMIDLIDALNKIESYGIGRHLYIFIQYVAMLRILVLTITRFILGFHDYSDKHLGGSFQDLTKFLVFKVKWIIKVFKITLNLIYSISRFGNIGLLLASLTFLVFAAAAFETSIRMVSMSAQYCFSNMVLYSIENKWSNFSIPSSFVIENESALKRVKLLFLKKVGGYYPISLTEAALRPSAPVMLPETSLSNIYKFFRIKKAMSFSFFKSFYQNQPKLERIITAFLKLILSQNMIVEFEPDVLRNQVIVCVSFDRYRLDKANKMIESIISSEIMSYTGFKDVNITMPVLSWIMTNVEPSNLTQHISKLKQEWRKTFKHRNESNVPETIIGGKKTKTKRVNKLVVAKESKADLIRNNNVALARDSQPRFSIDREKNVITFSMVRYKQKQETRFIASLTFLEAFCGLICETESEVIKKITIIANMLFYPPQGHSRCSGSQLVSHVERHNNGERKLINAHLSTEVTPYGFKLKFSTGARLIFQKKKNGVWHAISFCNKKNTIKKCPQYRNLACV